MADRTLAAPMREFLLWVARTPRTYGEAMNAWGSHCPRFTVWEDALAARLIEIEDRLGLASDEAPIRLTGLGRETLPD